MPGPTRCVGARPGGHGCRTPPSGTEGCSSSSTNASRRRWRRGNPDHVVLRNAIAEDQIIVTENARDFRGLVGREELHSGLLILPCVSRHRCLQLLEAAIAFLESEAARADEIPADHMVNRVIEVDATGQCRIYRLPDID
ncbi:MAG: DUF5615 family PIN-like protein [Paracoccaceae bacterium]